MAQVVQATCPGCKAVLRVPAKYATRPVRCKGCGMVLQLRKPDAPPPTPPALAAAPTPPPDPRPKGPPPLARPVPAAPEASPFAFDDLDAAPANPARRGRRRSRGWGGVVAAVVILALTGVGVYGVYIKVLQPRQQAALSGEEEQEAAASPGKSGKKGGRSSEPVAAPFPRRALVISVHNYLYANPIPDGPADAPNLDRLLTALNRGLRIPAGQIVHLSDASKKDPRPPLKAVIEQALVNFLKTTRKQDRILVLFAGHTKEIDGKAYLVPLEGELDNAQTLIPLDWVYKQLAGCDCRQKVLVLDGNRFNPAQGEERPAAGPMGAKFEAALKAPPDGVQVWSACSAGQQSREFEEAPLGLFLDSLRQGLAAEKGKKGALEGKIQKPDDLIPVEALHDFVNARMAQELERRKLGQQAAFAAGKAPATGASYDRDEQPAEAPALPVLNYGDRKLVQAILGEISLPPLKGGEGGGQDVSLALLPPFPAEVLKKYEGADLPAGSKLRQATHKARVALWAISTAKAPPEIEADVQAFRGRVKVDLSIMRERYGKPGGGDAETAFKKRVYEDSQAMARIVSRLENVLDDLKEAAEEAGKAPPRWRANYQFLLARFQAQLAYLEEYQGLLGQMRRELPEHDANLHTGWRMASKEKAGDAVGKKLERAVRKIYADLATEHPRTPWEVLAKREKLTALGLEWKAY